MASDFPTYPIYRVSTRWAVDTTDDYEPGPQQVITAKRHWDSTGWNFIEREEIDIEAKAKEILESWWPQYRTRERGGGRLKSLADLNASAPAIDISLQEYEEWCLKWFCHVTWDIGQTDDEAVQSFDRFLTRKGVRQNCDPMGFGRADDGGYCAMGAEDRWRWRGENDGDPPPCRCAGCKKNGVIIINH